MPKPVDFDTLWSQEGAALQASTLAGAQKGKCGAQAGTQHPRVEQSSRDVRAQRLMQDPMTCMHVHSEHAGFVAKFAGKQGVVTMHVGLPPDQTFPLTSLSADTSSGDRIDITDPSKVGVPA